jgi:hypothetical protein
VHSFLTEMLSSCRHGSIFVSNLLRTLTFFNHFANLVRYSQGGRAQLVEHTIVARFRSGGVVRGTTTDFSPIRDVFTLSETLPDGSVRSVEVPFRDLKAVFFVKTLKGDRNYREQKLQIPSGKPGTRLLITFEDGEVLRGTTLGVNLTSRGFLLFPADSGSNNKRIFVLRSAIKEMREE